MDRLAGRGLSLPRACQAAVCLAWLVLLADTLLTGFAVNERILLCAVTVAAAVNCWCRAVTHRAERAVWSVMAIGFTGYAGGFVILFFISMGEGAGPFGLNLSDCASLLLYPAGYAALLLLTRARVRSWQTSAVLDGGVVALAASAVAVTWAAWAYPTLLVGNAVNVIYALAYPVGGATLLVVALTGLAMTRWQLDATWALVLLGLAVMTVGQAIYGNASAAGTFRFGSPVDAVYTAGPVLVSLAAWRQPSRSLQKDGNAPVAMVVPGLATLIALAVLLLDHRSAVPTAAVALAGGAILVAVFRTAAFFRQERQLAESRRQAQTDDLTGLPNRRALLELITPRLTGEGGAVGLLLIDLDGFKEVNDTLGHAAGDRLLIEIADRLRLVDGSVARLGGDEFALLVGSEVTDLPAYAADVRQLITAATTIDGCRVSVGASIGISTAEPPVADRTAVLTAGELLRRADVALYRAKHLRSGVEPWLPALDNGARDRLGLVVELRAALASPDQIVVHYQPKVAPRTGVVQAQEALVRWQHPRRGLLAPGAFLDVVEQAGLLPQLTRRVLDLVLTEQSRAGLGAPPVAVNVSAEDLVDPDFAGRVAAQLLARGLDAGCLRIEVTETVVMSDPDRILDTLTRLQSLGLGLSLDDYGTGLSSLSYLRSLPVDELKIDRSFVRHMTTDPASALIVGSTISLAHGLGLRVVAEGVEDVETLEALADAGCDLVQGYLTGRPAPVDAPRTAWLPRQRPHQAAQAPRSLTA